MGDWLSDIWSGISSTASDIWSGISSGASDVWSSVFGDDTGDASGFDLGGIAGTLPDFGGFFPGDEPQAGPADVVLRSDDMNGNGGAMVPVGGLGAMAAAGGIWLGSLLARTMGGAARGAIFTAANGVRVRMGELWPLVRRYGAPAVYGALALAPGQLATLLSSPEALQPGRRRGGRGRGITAAQLRTTRRTLKTIRKMYFMLPTRRASSPRWGYHRSYRRR